MIKPRILIAPGWLDSTNSYAVRKSIDEKISKLQKEIDTLRAI